MRRAATAMTASSVAVPIPTAVVATVVIVRRVSIWWYAVALLHHPATTSAGAAVCMHTCGAAVGCCLRHVRRCRWRCMPESHRSMLLLPLQIVTLQCCQGVSSDASFPE
jgi:hypothetical protein